MYDLSVTWGELDYPITITLVNYLPASYVIDKLFTINSRFFCCLCYFFTNVLSKLEGLLIVLLIVIVASLTRIVPR